MDDNSCGVPYCAEQLRDSASCSVKSTAWVAILPTSAAIPGFGEGKDVEVWHHQPHAGPRLGISQ